MAEHVGGKHPKGKRLKSQNPNGGRKPRKRTPVPAPK